MAAALKDHVDESLVSLLADRFGAVDPGFDPERFAAAVVPELDALELKARIELIADALDAELPENYLDAIDVVEAVAPSLGEMWAAWPLCTFVERHGLDHPERSLQSMTTLTQHCSCEFALRPYLEHHLELTRSAMRTWARSEHETVRRLPSEGSRPLLPWAPRVRALLEDPTIGTEVLGLLYADPSAAVRRSVANHLNDLSRQHPDLVVELIADWQKRRPAVDDRLVGAALRTMVKRGDPRALELLGYSVDPLVHVETFACQPDRIELGDAIELTARLTSNGTEPQHLVIDFVIHHVTALGAVSPKVFKWTTTWLHAGSTIVISKRRSIQPLSTRRYHSGLHRVDLQIGGQVLASTQFDLAVRPAT